METGPDNLVYQSMAFLFHEADREMPEVSVRCQNEIPLARGLGSSAAAIAAGLAAANALCSKAFSPNELLEMAATLEGHPDNVAAAVLGGLQLVVSDQRRLYTVSVNLPPEVHAVLFIPDTRIATADARAVVPTELSIADAVFNMGRTALLVAGMATNHPEYFSVATQDRLHQPYRQALFPAMKLLFQAATDAGALGVFPFGQRLHRAGAYAGQGDDSSLRDGRGRQAGEREREDTYYSTDDQRRPRRGVAERVDPVSGGLLPSTQSYPQVKENASSYGATLIWR